MPEPDVKRHKEFGDEINRRFSKPIASTLGNSKKITFKVPKINSISEVVLM